MIDPISTKTIIQRGEAGRMPAQGKTTAVTTTAQTTPRMTPPETYPIRISPGDRGGISVSTIFP